MKESDLGLSSDASNRSDANTQPAALSQQQILDSLQQAYQSDSTGMQFWEVARSHRCYNKPPSYALSSALCDKLTLMDCAMASQHNDIDRKPNISENSRLFSRIVAILRHMASPMCWDLLCQDCW